MDIKELIERVKLTEAEMKAAREEVRQHIDLDSRTGLLAVSRWIAQAQLNKVLESDLALVIREGDEVPLGVDIETHPVVLLKKVLKEVNND